MKLPVMKPDVSRRRFSLPNAIWTWKLKPPAFAVLAYLQYRHSRKFGGAVTSEELAEQIRMSVEMAEAGVEVLTGKGLLSANLIPILPNVSSGKFFSVPDEVFQLRLGHGALAVYAYLLYCEDRRTHQCHPSYNCSGRGGGGTQRTTPAHTVAMAGKWEELASTAVENF